MNFNIEVNSKVIQARKGDTILTALKRNGISVPTLCSYKGLSITGACRICVVEVDGIHNLVTSCSYPVQEGMKVLTHSQKVLNARKTLVELLLSNHPDDCLYCERNGNCELQDLSIELNVRERRISGRKSKHRLDLSSPSIVRDPAKCVLCSRCIRVCDEVQSVTALEFINRGSNTVVGTSMNHDLNFSTCISCGQCVMVCPTAALQERSSLDEIRDVLSSKEKKVVVQFSPEASVSLAEEFGLKPGKNINGLIVSALNKIGFDYIFDSSFAADIAIMEKASELKDKLDSKQSNPLISSYCPSVIKYIEQFYPNLLPMVSLVKSPQQILGTIVKTHFAQSQGISPNNIFSVSISPCIGRKMEVQREEMASKGLPNVDLVLSAREVVKLIRLYGIDMQNIEPQQGHAPFGVGSSAGKLFAISGGTAEGVFRTLYHGITGKEMSAYKINDLRYVSSLKEVELKAGSTKVKVAILNGLTNAHKFFDDLQNGLVQADYIEVMACTGGCLSGGGQPFGKDEMDFKIYAKSIYDLDEVDTIKVAHKNPARSYIYSNFLEKVASEKAKKLLHVSYRSKNI